MWPSLIEMKESFLSNDKKGWWLAETSQGNPAVTGSDKTTAEEAKY